MPIAVSLTARTLVLAAALAIAVWLAPGVATFASLGLLAGILAAALVPPIAWVARRTGWSREWAVTAVFGLMGLLAAGAALWIVPTVVEQVRGLAAGLPGYIAHLDQALDGVTAQAQAIATRLGGRGLPPGSLPDPGVLLDAARQHLGGAVGSGLELAGKAIGLVGMGAVVLMLAFFLLLEGPTVRAGLLSLVPPPHRPLLDAQVAPITAKLGGYVQGMAIGIAGLALYEVLVLTALGLPMALALGLLSALFAIVPLVGGVLGVIPPALVALSIGWPAAVWALVLGYLGHFVVANFVLPAVFARSVQLSALTVTVALLVGSEAFGIFGALVAVPMAAALQVLVQNLWVAAIEARHAPDERRALRVAPLPLPRLKVD